MTAVSARGGAAVVSTTRCWRRSHGCAAIGRRASPGGAAKQRSPDRHARRSKHSGFEHADPAAAFAWYHEPTARGLRGPLDAGGDGEGRSTGTAPGSAPLRLKEASCLKCFSMPSVASSAVAGRVTRLPRRARTAQQGPALPGRPAHRHRDRRRDAKRRHRRVRSTTARARRRAPPASPPRWYERVEMTPPPHNPLKLPFFVLCAIFVSSSRS
jgi:hypothetical protein